MTLKKRILTLGIFSFMLSGIMFCSLIDGSITQSQAYGWGESGFNKTTNESKTEIQLVKNKIDTKDPEYDRTKHIQLKQELESIATEAYSYCGRGILLWEGKGVSASDARQGIFFTYREIIDKYNTSSVTPISSIATSSAPSATTSSGSAANQTTTTNTNAGTSANTNAGISTTTTTNQNVITLDLHGGSLKGDSVIAGVNTTYEVLVSDIQYVTLASYTQNLVPPEGYHFMSWAVENGNPVSEFSASLAGKTIYAVWADDVTSVIMGGYPWSFN